MTYAHPPKAKTPQRSLRRVAPHAAVPGLVAGAAAAIMLLSGCAREQTPKTGGLRGAAASAPRAASPTPEPASGAEHASGEALSPRADAPAIGRDDAGPSKEAKSAKKRAPKAPITKPTISVASSLAPEPEPERSPLPRQGSAQLTAGIFDDNRSFDFFRTYQGSIQALQLPGLPAFALADQVRAHELYASAQKPHGALDVSLVIDTTGSMGDELSYLQGEFQRLASAISEAYPDAPQRWSLVVYRDAGDEYVYRAHDFTSSIPGFQATLAAQGFDGGGDYPEAPEQALNAATQLRWQPEAAVARMLFWVADAPHHSERAEQLVGAVMGAKRAGIHIYPVASSGVDELTEYSMRASAQMTHGRYVFLTDDSGIGLSHKKPTLPCYYVTSLSAAILRAVHTEMAGHVPPPEPASIVRQVGTLDATGACSQYPTARAF